MPSIDLHTHSHFSDGLLSPSKLVQTACELGLAGLSLTDHDTVEGLDEFMRAGERYRVATVPGIEISSYFGEKPLHILGYGFDWHHPALEAQLVEMQRIRDERNHAIQNRFRSLGIPISDEELAAVSDGQVGRPHFARVLCDKKIVANQDEAFVKFLRRNGLAYVAKEKYPAAKAIGCIREAGGVAVLAHPWCSDHTLATIPLLLNRLKDIGLEGVEVYYPAHSPKVQRTLLDLSRKLGLLVTGGSDFHGLAHSAYLAGDKRFSFRVRSDIFTDLRLRLQKVGGQQIPLTGTDE